MPEMDACALMLAVVDNSSTAALVDCAVEIDVANASDADADDADWDAVVLVVAAAAFETATEEAERVLASDVEADRVAAKDAVDVLV